jgi:hypothetical protein
MSKTCRRHDRYSEPSFIWTNACIETKTFIKANSSSGVVQRFHKNDRHHRKIIVRLRERLTCLVLLKAKLPEIINHARIKVPCRFVRDNGILISLVSYRPIPLVIGINKTLESVPQNPWNPMYTTTDWPFLQGLQTQINRKSESQTSDVQKSNSKYVK